MTSRRLPADPEADAIPIEFVQPNICGSAQDFAQITYRQAGGPPCGEVLLVNPKGLLEDIQTSGQLCYFVRAILLGS